jgi:hypothetical protein
VAAAIGLPGLHFHDLRHTGNTLTAQDGVSLADLKARLGHDSARAAMIYQHAVWQDPDLWLRAQVTALPARAKDLRRSQTVAKVMQPEPVQVRSLAQFVPASVGVARFKRCASGRGEHQVVIPPGRSEHETMGILLCPVLGEVTDGQRECRVLTCCFGD